MAERIGVIAGMEQSFPQYFCEAVNRVPGFSAELAKLGGTPIGYQCPYRVLIDRLSHEVPFYKIYLKAAALSGTFVINDPFWWAADDKFFGYSLAQKIGVPVPRTVVLPSRSYIPAIDPQKSLRNLEYPLDWEGITRYIGWPAILKPAEGGGWKSVTKVSSLEELWDAYNKSERLVMTLQEFIDFDEYVRCICIGREHILPIRWDPRKALLGYQPDENFLPKALEEKILEHAYALNSALGYDMNSVEFAIKDGVPYAIDFTNPAPDLERERILPKHFDWAIDKMVKVAIAAAKEHRGPDESYTFQRYLRERGLRSHP